MAMVVTAERAECARRGRLDSGSTIAAHCSAFEAAGVEFIAEDGGGPGVRLRKASG